MEFRVRALETILVEKGYVETAALDQIVEAYETKIRPHIGARVVLRRGAIGFLALASSRMPPWRSVH